MTLIRHELKQAWKSLLIWTLAIGLFMVVCVVIYPEMKGQMDDISSIFASMGAFSSAFGLDKMDFGTLTGFYGVECGNILGIGGAIFAALIGIGALMNEEKNRTAEFLLTHPMSRAEIVTVKLVSVLVQLVVMNAVVLLMFVIPVKMKWLGLIDLILTAVGVVSGIIVMVRTLEPGTFPYLAWLLPVVALLNYFLFFGKQITNLLPDFIRWHPTQKSWKRAVKQGTVYNAPRARDGARFRCTVCGRTEISNPGLEFRYCSKCAGYRCYCQDHINNHAHITE